MFNVDGFLQALFSGEPIRGEEIGFDRFSSHGFKIAIDTCFTNDTQKYETAIKINDDDMVVVEEYDSAAEAREGHSKWIEICGRSEFYFSSIQDGTMHIYKGES